MNSGLYLEIENQSKENGAKAVQCKYSNRASQLWKFVETGDGYYFIINKNSGKYLEVADNSTADGASVGQWESTGYKCQKWTLRKEGIQ